MRDYDCYFMLHFLVIHFSCISENLFTILTCYVAPTRLYIQASQLIDLLSRPTLKITSAHGVELNRPLVWYSRIKLFCSNKLLTTSKVTFSCKNMWKTNLSVYDTVLLFGVDTMMESIEQKLTKELSNGSIVITARYPLPNIQASKSIIDGPHSVYLYKM
ncbi:unnamed protein product [Schistosoma rodhaini]|nr:unnamed protein product [Schistosoma rodhaini]